MADAKIGSLMKTYAAKGGVSAAEIKKLDTAINSDLKVSKAEYQALVAAKKQYGSTFSPATQREFDRLLNPLTIAPNGKVTNKFFVWQKAWKIDQDAGFRQKWGIKDKNDVKAPTFHNTVSASKVPAEIREKFSKRVGMFYKDEVAKDEGGGRYKPVNANDLGEIYSRDGKVVGYQLTYAEKNSAIFVTQFYKKDGTPAGGELWASKYPPHD